MAIRAETIYIEVDARIQKAVNDLKKTDTQSNKLFNTFKKLAGPIGIALVAKQMIRLGTEFSKAASDAEEVSSKYATIFNNISGEAEAMADNFAKDFGLAGSSARELLGNTADLVTGFGLTQSAALDVSQATNQLAVDLASFSNAQGGAAAVSAALTSAYTGEREALKTYGIVISEAMVKAELLKQAEQGLTFASEQQAKITATLAIAQRQSTNAIGDAQRTWESHANVVRRLGEHNKELKEELGEMVNQGLTPMLSATDKLVSKLAEWLKNSNDINKVIRELEGGVVSADTSIESMQGALAKLNREYKDAVKWATADSTAIKENIDSLTEQIGWKQRQLAMEGQYGEQIRKNAEEQAILDEAKKIRDENARIAAEEWAEKDAALTAATWESKLEIFKAEREKQDEITEQLKQDGKTRTEDAKKSDDDATKAREANFKKMGTVIAGFASGPLEDLGAALVKEGDAWGTLGKSAIYSIAGVVKALGDQAVIKAALAYASLNFGVGAAYTAAAGAAFIASGAIKASADKSFQTGTGMLPFTPNGGSSGADSNLIAVSDKEEVTVKPRGETGGGQTINFYLEKEIIYSIANEGIESGDIVIRPENVQGGAATA